MYIQPFLNGLRPDLVLLNPMVGIAVFEVKDWNLEGDRYRVVKANGEQRLAVQTGHGKGPKTIRTSDDPVAKVQLYEREILELYCPRLEDQFGRSPQQAVSAGIIFTKADGHEAKSLLEPLLSSGMQKYSQYYPISGRDDLELGRLSKVFPEASRPSSNVMSESAAEDLRGWLREPAFSQEQRTPPPLDRRQRDIARNRPYAQRRRVRGPAGSGKTLGLAARAAELASRKQHVLVCTYNITLINYIRDLTRQYARTRGQSRPEVEYFNFHHWCKLVCSAAGRESDYKALWSSKGNEDVLDDDIAELVQQIYKEATSAAPPFLYDAILVDEGQDFRLSWWQALREAVRPGGEMLLMVDKTQNVYGTAKAWTEESMVGAGFSGRWSELRNSYRLPPNMVPHLDRYVAEFLKGEDVDTPKADQASLNIDQEVDLRWIQTRSPDASGACTEAILDQLGHLHRGTAAADVTFLCTSRVGLDVTEKLRQRNIKVLHTFNKTSIRGRDRRLKLSFFQGSEKVKATTLHSFKGWEAVQLIVYVDSVASAEDRAVFYAALTRIKRREMGSALTVVCSTPDLAEYGRTWPRFEEFRDRENILVDD